MENLSNKDKFKVKHFVKNLENYRGRHTELISVYVPAGYDLNKITTHLYQEQGTASNIKSKGTRDNVIAALERMIQHLKTYTRTPTNGLVAFAGNVAEREGQQDYQVWSLEPPIPLNQRLYRCDKEFVLDPLRELADDRSIYGLVVMDRRDATLALLKGKTIIPLATTHSEVPGKTRAGGQSAQRFERLREGATKDHYKKVAELMKKEFLGRAEILGILIGGPSTTVNDFMNKDYVTGDVKKKIIGTRDLSYTGDFGLQELLQRSEDILSEEDVTKEKLIMQKFFTQLSKDTGMVEYGLEVVKEALQKGAVELLLLSERLDDNLIEELEKTAEEQNTEVEIISVETTEGKQLSEMGGVVCMLRYKQN